MTRPTAQQLQEWLTLTQAATQGRWRARKPGHGNATKYRCVQLGKDDRYTTLELLPEDAAMIAASQPGWRETLELAIEQGERIEKLEAALRDAQMTLHFSLSLTSLSPESAQEHISRYREQAIQAHDAISDLLVEATVPERLREEG